MSDADELIVVAQIAGAHGVRGDVKVRSFTDYPEDCFAYGPLLDETGKEVLEARKITSIKDGFIVWPTHPLQREEWIAMKGKLLHVWRSQLPAPEEDEFYFSDLVGCDVLHSDGRNLGRVLNVQNYGADDLLEIKSGAGEVYFLPFTKEGVPEVDLVSKKIIAQPMEELLPPSLTLIEDDEQDERE